MTDLLFDPPWLLIAGVVLVGGYLFWSGNRKGDATLRNVGIGVALLSVVLLALGAAFDTATETVTKRTRQFVQAINDRDWQTFGTLLDARTSFAIYQGKQALLDGAQRSVERIGLKGVRVTSLTAQPADTVITVDVNCISEQDIVPYPMPTSWRMNWENTGTGWRLAKIEALPTSNLKPDQVTQQLVPPK